MRITRPINVLYDKATPKFSRLGLEDRHELFKRLWGEKNKFTTETLGQVAEVTNRDMLLLSSTSYTPDEDFDLVVEALKSVNQKIIDQKGR